MVHLSKLAASLATVVQLLPARRHVHVWNDCGTPPACEQCGRCEKPANIIGNEVTPSWLQRLRAAMDDALDCWGD